MWHSESDCVQCKFMEALPLIRTISGDGYGTEVEQRCMEVMLEAQGPDGLVYLPKAGRPWCVFKTSGKEPPGDHYVSRWFEGGSWALRDLPFVPPGAVGRPVARERRVPHVRQLDHDRLAEGTLAGRWSAGTACRSCGLPC